MPETNKTTEGRLVAAVDLGSNSFHMTVAKLTSSGVITLIRDRERVRLASGLNHKNVLDKESIARGAQAWALVLWPRVLVLNVIWIFVKNCRLHCIL